MTIANASEEWLPIIGHEGYEVSDQGHVRSLDRMIYDPRWRKYRRYPGKVLAAGPIKAGYLRVKLGAKHNGVGIHRLMAEAFIGLCPAGKQVCHNDGDKTNNTLANLRYGTISDNAIDRVRHGRQTDKRGVLHHNAKLAETHVRAIRRSKAPLAILAAKYGVTDRQISKIRLGQRWAHIL